MNEQDNPTKEEWTDMQRRFVDYYCRLLNATKAAYKAGYSGRSARQMGSENLSKPYIRAAIDKKLSEMSLTATETTKSLSDIASSRLNDFMIIRPVQGCLMDEVYVTTIITHSKNEIKQIQGFITKNKLTKKAREPFDQKISAIYQRILEDEIEVEKYGDDVTRLVRGKPVVQYVAELDLVALAKARDTGRLKSLKHTKDGVQVEMYAADAALRDMARIHNLFESEEDLNNQTRVIRKKADDGH